MGPPPGQRPGSSSFDPNPSPTAGKGLGPGGLFAGEPSRIGAHENIVRLVLARIRGGEAALGKLLVRGPLGERVGTTVQALIAEGFTAPFIVAGKTIFADPDPCRTGPASSLRASDDRSFPGRRRHAGGSGRCGWLCRPSGRVIELFEAIPEGLRERAQDARDRANTANRTDREQRQAT